MKEPSIKVGIIDRTNEIRIRLNDFFRIRQANSVIQGSVRIRAEKTGFSVTGSQDSGYINSRILTLSPENSGTFSIREVRIGINFHWEQIEEQTFRGELCLLLRKDGTMAVINQILLEEYLASVISSEMGAGAPVEFLKAHAVASRSWLAAMLERRDELDVIHTQHEILTPDSILRWYEREDHELYDVCADDHCQRYQGITKVISANAVRAIKDTSGMFLVCRDRICDARFYKACGGITERYENTWENRAVPYLREVSDSEVPYQPIRSEQEARDWIFSSPDVFCHVSDPEILENILPAFDRETDFFRWKVIYDRSELEEILQKKSGVDFGTLKSLEPLERGPSGRISKLRITGSKKTVVVGKELEIRRWLSRTHLLSSAFVIDSEQGPDGSPERFILTGAGWGHGVGMCQIGAAVMAMSGYKAEDILKHYFPGAQLKKYY